MEENYVLDILLEADEKDKYLWILNYFWKNLIQFSDRIS